MAWEDRTPFDAIKNQFGINEKNVKYILRSSLKLKTYLVWKKSCWKKNKTFIVKFF